VKGVILGISVLAYRRACQSLVKVGSQFKLKLLIIGSQVTQWSHLEVHRSKALRFCDGSHGIIGAKVSSKYMYKGLYVGPWNPSLRTPRFPIAVGNGRVAV
jgi:hypothetical protein